MPPACRRWSRDAARRRHELDFATVDVFTIAIRAIRSPSCRTRAAHVGTDAGESGGIQSSETTFVLRRRMRQYGASSHLYPARELPFAGHPNVGTAFVLAAARSSAARSSSGDTMIFEEKAGLVHIQLLRDRSAVTGRVSPPASFFHRRKYFSRNRCSACSIAETDHRHASAPAVHCVLRAAADFRCSDEPAALAAARPRSEFSAQHALATHPPLRGATSPVADIEARMFAPVSASPKIGDRLRQRGADRSFGHTSPEPDLRLERRISQASTWAAQAS